MLIHDQFLRALAEGEGALPEDPRALMGWLRLLEDLLTEKSRICEDDWLGELGEMAETDALLRLEAMVAEKAGRVRAGDMDAVMAKFEIWRFLAADAEEERSGYDARDRLVRSIEVDLGRMAGMASERAAIS